MKKIMIYSIILYFLLHLISCNLKKRIDFIQNVDKIDILINDSLFTSYLYGKHLSKPILYPVKSPSGETVTRWYPFKEIEGESSEHPHHTGIYFTYGSNGEVNGNSFWHNLHDRPPLTKEMKIPQIRHDKIIKMKGGKSNGRLVTLNYWIDKNNVPILEENRTMEFYAINNEYKIDFTFRLTALDTTVTFEDTKEGMFAIRVADWLAENSKGTLFQSTGQFLNAEGEKTEKNVWGKQSSWVRLEGTKNEKNVGVVIFHHPNSVNYPTFWHARAYGCFAANPIGQYGFQEGTGIITPKYRQLKLDPGKTAIFKFRMVIYEGSKNKEDCEKEFLAFSKTKI